MVRQGMTAAAVLMMMASAASAQDAKTVLGNAARAMGIENVTAVHFYGSAEAGNLGQNNNANQPWPMAPMNDYVRAIDFSQPASRATWATFAVPVTGGRAALAQGTPQTQQVITPATTAWGQQLEIWITPWGFVKGGLANSCDGAEPDRERHALSGGDVERAGEVAGRPALPGGRLHQRPGPGGPGADLGREPDLRRHAGRGRLQLSTATATG